MATVDHEKLRRSGAERRWAHTRSEACYRLRLPLTHRRYLKRGSRERDPAFAEGVWHSLATHRFVQAAREAVAGDALVSKLIDAMLKARGALEHGITLEILQTGPGGGRRALATTEILACRPEHGGITEMLLR